MVAAAAAGARAAMAVHRRTRHQRRNSPIGDGQQRGCDCAGMYRICAHCDQPRGRSRHRTRAMRVASRVSPSSPPPRWAYRSASGSSYSSPTHHTARPCKTWIERGHRDGHQVAGSARCPWPCLGWLQRAPATSMPTTRSRQSSGLTAPSSRSSRPHIEHGGRRSRVHCSRHRTTWATSAHGSSPLRYGRLRYGCDRYTRGARETHSMVTDQCRPAPPSSRHTISPGGRR